MGSYLFGCTCMTQAKEEALSMAPVCAEVLGSTELEGDLFAVGEIKRLVFDSAGGSEKEL